MTYGEIIRKNCQNIQPSWWPRYAYHFTDVTNIVSILKSGKLYSRVQANQKGIMENDNASRQVIDMTETRATAYARFYFRPLTPTQYYNEGYKHRQIRYAGDENANVPVPIFLAFDLEQVLLTPGVVFSEQSQAGHGSPLFSGVEAFSNLPFDKIYSDGACNDEVRKYRHAEILCPDFYPIEDSLRMILCRNECEKATLLNMLSVEDQVAYFRYKGFVRVAREDTFLRNGLYIESIVCHDRMISFEFSSTPKKREFERKYSQGSLSELTAAFLFQWLSKKGEVLYSAIREIRIDYTNPDRITFSNLPEISRASTLRITLRIEDKIICVSKQPISSYELI